MMIPGKDTALSRSAAPLNDNGTPYSVKRVQRHMAKQGLRSVVVKKITIMQTTEPSQMIK